jgi:pyrrolidone-carboxylate peptidase
LKSKWICALFLATFVSIDVLAGEPAPSSAKPVILLTAFEPFGGSPFNTSWDVVSLFEGREIAGYVIRTAKLRVVYDAIGGPLAEAIEKTKPVAVISFGEGSTEVQIERVARNGYHQRKPRDNEGKPPPRTAIITDGRLMAQKNAPSVRGFVHLPIVPPIDTTRRKQLDEAVQIIVKTVIESVK